MSLLMEALKKAELAKKKALTDQQAANQDTVYSLADNEERADFQDESSPVEMEHNLLDVPSELGINEDELELELEKMLDVNNDAVHSEKLLDDSDKGMHSKKMNSDELQLLDHDVSSVDDNHSTIEGSTQDVEEEHETERFENVSLSDDSLPNVPIESNSIDYPYPDEAENKLNQDDREAKQDLTATPSDDVSTSEIAENSSLDLSDINLTSPKKSSPGLNEKLEEVRARDQIFSGANKNNLDNAGTTTIIDVEKQNEVKNKVGSKVKDDPFVAAISSSSSSANFNTKNPKKYSSKRNIISLGVLSVILIGAVVAYMYLEDQLQSFSTGVVQPTPVNQDLEIGLNNVDDEQEDESLLKSNSANDVSNQVLPAQVPKIPKVPVKVGSASKSLVNNTQQKPPSKTAIKNNVTSNKKPVVPALGSGSEVQKQKKLKTNTKAINKKPVSISRTNEVDETYQLLLEAYNDFNNGKYEAAKEKYQKVLQQSEDNRDALLGLAAISVRNNNINSAQVYYSQLLRKNKHDSVALAGLVDIVGKMDPLAAESELKTLLSREAGAAYLHFALGNVYVAQQRWADAQASYFIASSIDKGSADYAYNLAVSLDMLGESKQAVQYYEKALALSKEGRALFDPKVVADRLSLLQNSSGVK